MHNDLGFTFCYSNESSSESLGGKLSKHSKTIPLSISLDMIDAPQKSVKLSMKTVQARNKVNAVSSTKSLPPQLTSRSSGSCSLKEAIGSKILQKKNEEESRFLIGTYLRPTAFVENGFVIGSSGIEKSPGSSYYHSNRWISHESVLCDARCLLVGRWSGSTIFCADGAFCTGQQCFPEKFRLWH